MCESAVRQLLQANGVEVEPNEDLTGKKQAPDFRCMNGTTLFFVEVKCITIEKAMSETNLAQTSESGHASYFKPLNRAFYSAAVEKTMQCTNLDAPSLVAVGTFCFLASRCFDKRYVEMLLTGKTQTSLFVDPSTGNAVGNVRVSTQLKSATFLCPDKSKGLDHARNSISGMLLCGFGSEPSKIHGILHPSPARKFDRTLLPNVEFCRLRDGYKSGVLTTEWI